tara:strand:- start:358 stop:468 length:111 start_codon:yes stop_codon:yes gene_type:complete
MMGSEKESHSLKLPRIDIYSVDGFQELLISSVDEPL